MTLTDSQLAQVMLDWQEKKQQLDNLEKQISEAVMLRKKTFITGNVQAKYVSGRREFDYETSGRAASIEMIQQCTTTYQTTDWQKVCEAVQVPEDIIEQFTSTSEVVDWNKVCDESKIEAIVKSQGNASVKISIKE